MPNINTSYQWAVNTCNNPNVRYSQTYRNQQTIDGITYYDCSSFIWYSLIAGGFDCVAANDGSTWPFVTWTMGTVLERLGFVEVNRTGEIKAGDIGVYDYLMADGSHNGHTEMCYKGGNGAGIFMGARGSSLAPQDQVSIRANSTAGTSWQHIYRYQGGAGQPYITNYVIAAMCGNFMAESTVNPAIWESLTPTSWDHQYAYDNIGGFGLGQWTNVGTPHGRCWNLHEWVTSNGYADGDGIGQLEFLIHEAYWSPTSISQSAYNTLEDFLHSDSTDINELTKEYMWHWEGINNRTLSNRQQFAQRAYTYITEHFNDNNITTWISGNFYLSESQALNNCVLIARYLSSGYIPSHIGIFKIWMAKQHWIRKKRRLII